MEHKFDPTADVDYKNSIFTQMYEGLKPRDISEKPMDFRYDVSLDSRQMNRMHLRSYEHSVLNDEMTPNWDIL